MNTSESVAHESASESLARESIVPGDSARESASESLVRESVAHVQGLNVSLGGRRVLEDINFSLSRGELLGLIGPNGAGKTTLMRSMMGLLPVDSGDIILESGVNSLGYVPQRQNIDWDYPISIQTFVASAFLGVLHMWQRPRKKHWHAVYQALEHVGLFELRQRPIGELSGGQKQRVLIARALAVNPSVLLLDEPFTGLDYPNQDSLSELFRHLASGGVAILMSTHDLNQAIDISDRIMMLNGSVRALGAPQELKDPDLWMRTYCVRPDSPLLRSVGLVMA